MPKKAKTVEEPKLEEQTEQITAEFAEDIEDEAVAEAEGEAEELDEVEDHTEVSSEEVAGGEVDVESSEYGEEEAPAAVETDAELESMPGYNETESLVEVEREEIAERVGEERLLDAWYADFGDPATMGLLLQQPKLTETMAEVVIGRDDRIRITNTTAYPWRCICALRITARDGSRWIGTGWLVGPRTVITAGHVVYIHRRGGWVRRVEVIPGCNGSTRRYGSCFSSSLRSVKGWTRKKKRSRDYGAIILPKNCAYGRRLGYFGYANLNYFSLLGLRVNLSGYPGDKPSCTQWWHARRIKFVTSRTIVYNVDTAGGQSGSPVWRLRKGKRHAVGIHTNGSSSGNSATRIVRPVFKNIKKWKAEGM